MPETLFRLTHLTIIFTLAAIIALTAAQSQTTRTSLAGARTAEAFEVQAQHRDSNQSQSTVLRSTFVPLDLLSNSIWQRLSDNFQFAQMNNRRIDEQIQSIKKGLGTLHNNLVKAKPFLFHIVEQLEHAEIPLDVALLPLIESAFNPLAVSSENAVGLWQFIPSTAKHYGLSVNQGFDERLDVVAATTAAIRYLSDLNQTFDGDWLLTLAAYNTGPGNVRRAIKRAIDQGIEPTYWNLKLSRETTNYVPRLIAAVKMVNNPQTYGLTLPVLADREKIQSLWIGRRISFTQIAELTNATTEEIKQLNPGLRNGMTPIYGPHRLVLPIEITSQLLNRLKQLEQLPSVERQTQLEMVRRNISNPLAIDSDVLNSSLLDNKNYYSAQASYFQTHTVQHGDTLWSLSRKAGVNVETLRSWNNLTDDEPIKKGDTIYIAYVSTEAEANAAGLMNYRVAPADNLHDIAEKFDLTINDIRKWNSSVRNEDYIQAGQVLRIPTFPTESRKYSP